MNYPNELKSLAITRMKDAKVEGFLSGNGNPHANLMFVGEAPGKTEIITKQPFSGRAGKELDSLLTELNLTRQQIYITSTIRSRPYKEKNNQDISTAPNRKPTKKEIKAHAILLDYEINQVNPKIIATLGDVALKRLLGNKFKLADCHGQLMTSPIYYLNNNQYKLTTKKYHLIPLYHPAAVFYNPKLRPIIKQDWQNLHHYLKHN